MRLLASALFCALLASGQTRIPISEWEPPPVRKLDLPNVGKLMQPVHIHPFGDKCTGASNGIYMKSGNTYYACMNGKAVCSADKGAIPQKYIQEFDRSRAEFTANIEQFKAARRTTPGQTQARAQSSRVGRNTKSKNSVGVEQAPPAPPSAAVEEERLRALAAGATMDDVLAQFGDPYARLSGEYERFTYRLTSGGSARLDFEKGKLTKTQFVPAPRMP